MAKEPVGLILRKFQNMRRMSMEDLSERTGINIQTISRYEPGDSEKVPFTETVTLARALALSASSLAAGAGMHVIPDQLEEVMTQEAALVVRRATNLMAELPESQQAFLATAIDRAVQGEIQAMHSEETPINSPTPKLPA